MTSTFAKVVRKTYFCTRKNTTYTRVNGAIIKYRLKAKKQRLYITSFPLS